MGVRETGHLCAFARLSFVQMSEHSHALARPAAPSTFFSTSGCRSVLRHPFLSEKPFLYLLLSRWLVVLCGALSPSCRSCCRSCCCFLAVLSLELPSVCK